MPSFLYILPLEDKSSFKVGKSKHTTQRFNHLSRFYQFDASMSIKIECNSDNQAYKFESMIHMLLDEYRITLPFDGGTEFFKYSSLSYCNSIIKLLANQYKLPISHIQHNQILPEKLQQDMSTLIEQIKNQRILLKLTQHKVAELVDIDRTTYGLFENYKSQNISFYTILQILNVLGLSINITQPLLPTLDEL